ncbi:MAG: PDZ domain-containing protein [Chloroflexi bacterium]|nr:PDZ domain-containing protein [Chloroflexota bacterium]
MPRTPRFLILLVLAMFGLSVALPTTADASAISWGALTRLAQIDSSADARPGPIVRQAFDLIMDRLVVPPRSSVLLAGGLEGAGGLLEAKGIPAPGVAPGFTDNRREDWQTFAQVYPQFVQALGDAAPRELLDRSIVDGMARSVNSSHTYYMSPELFRAAQADLQNRTRYAGIGVSLTRDLVITEVFEGSPAEAAGVLPGDQIVGVNGESVEGQDSAATSGKVRGEPGTQVTISFRRADSPTPIDKTITRATVSYQWLRARILDGNIGYLKIRTWVTPDSLSLFNDAMQQFLDADVQGLIVDVRGNSGGSVATGEQVASRLIPPDQPLYQQIDRRGGERTVTTWGDYWDHDVPMAILTDGGSASMSEILASALKEDGIAQVIGTKTAGAVAAGVPYPLSDGSGLLVTSLLIKSARGNELESIGVEPDQVVEPDPAQLRLGKDVQLEAALGYIHEEANRRAAVRPAAETMPAPTPWSLSAFLPWPLQIR